MQGRRINWELYSPWRLPGLSALLRMILAWGLVEGIRSGFYSGYLPINNDSLGIPLATVGTAWTLHLLSDSFGKSVGGWLTQRFGLGAVTLVAGIIGWLAMAYAPRIHSPLALFVLSAVWGLAVSGILPGMMTLSSRQALQGREGRAITLTNLLTTPWSGIGTLSVGLLTKQHPQIAIDILVVAQIAVTVIGLTLFFKPARVSTAAGELYPWQRLMLFIPAAFGQTFAPALFSIYLLKYLQKLEINGFWIIVLAGIGAVCSYGLSLFTARHADKRSPRGLLIGGLALIAVALFWLSTTPSLGELMVIASVAGIGFATFGPAWNSLVVRVLPEQNRAAAWGTIMTFETLGHAVGPAVGGSLIGLFNMTTPFFVAGTIMSGLSIFYVIALWRPWWKTSES